MMYIRAVVLSLIILSLVIDETVAIEPPTRPLFIVPSLNSPFFYDPSFWAGLPRTGINNPNAVLGKDASSSFTRPMTAADPADYVSGRQYFGITNIFKNDCPVCRTCPAAPMLTAMPSACPTTILSSPLGTIGFTISSANTCTFTISAPQPSYTKLLIVCPILGDANTSMKLVEVSNSGNVTTMTAGRTVATTGSAITLTISTTGTLLTQFSCTWQALI